ncbi:MAG TPA: replication initiator protein A [Oculatellaceae cyanobacterium]
MIQKFTREQANLFTFYRIPKELFESPKYVNLDPLAKILYGFLLDRNSLSQSNDWVDEKGHIYIYFSREEVMERLKIARPKATSLFKELREVELIEEVRQGLGKPNIIYVGQFIPSQSTGELSSNPIELPDVRNSSFWTEGKITSGGKEKFPQDGRKNSPNKTELNYTEVNETESVSQSVPEETDRLTDELTLLYQKAQIELFQDEGLREILRDTIKALYIEQPSKIAKLDLSHIDEALARFRTAQEEKHITNKIGYFKQCLLSAIKELGLQNLGCEKPEQTGKDCGIGKEEVKKATPEEWQRFTARFHEFSQMVIGNLTGTSAKL